MEQLELDLRTPYEDDFKRVFIAGYMEGLNRAQNARGNRYDRRKSAQSAWEYYKQKPLRRDS